MVVRSVLPALLLITVMLAGCLWDDARFMDSETSEHERLSIVGVGAFNGGSCLMVDSNPLHSFPYPDCIYGREATELLGCNPAQMFRPYIHGDIIQGFDRYELEEEAIAAQASVTGPGGHYLHCEVRMEWAIDARGLAEGSRLTFTLQNETWSKDYECTFSANSHCRVSDAIEMSLTVWEPGGNHVELLRGEARIEWPTGQVHENIQSRMVYEWDLWLSTYK